MKKQIIVLALAFFSLATPVNALEAYQNPVDGHANVTTKRVAHGPQKETPKDKKIHLESLTLLSTQEDFSKNVSAEQLAAYVKAIEAIVNQKAENKDSGDLMVQIKLDKLKAPEIEMNHRGNLSQDFMQEVYNATNALKPYKTRVSSVKFQLLFSIAEK